MRTPVLVLLVLACACTHRGSARGNRPAAPATAAPDTAAPQDTALIRRAAELIHASPALVPGRGLGEQAAFVDSARALAPHAGRRPEDVRSVEDAMAVLESITAQRIARIHVMSPRPDLEVDVRRWSERRNPRAWTTLWTDTVIRRPAVAYQFRYRPPGARRDTTVERPCAHDCDVRLP